MNQEMKKQFEQNSNKMDKTIDEINRKLNQNFQEYCAETVRN